MSDMEKLISSKTIRPVYAYDLPDELANGVKSVGLVELTAEEELQAAKRSRGDTMRLAYELAKMSLVEVNGEKVSLSDGSSDHAWSNMAPKARSLVLAAYAELHAPPEGSTEAFLKSRRVKV